MGFIFKWVDFDYSGLASIMGVGLIQSVEDQKD